MVITDNGTGRFRTVDASKFAFFDQFGGLEQSDAEYYKWLVEELIIQLEEYSVVEWNECLGQMFLTYSYTLLESEYREIRAVGQFLQQELKKQFPYFFKPKDL